MGSEMCIGDSSQEHPKTSQDQAKTIQELSQRLPKPRRARKLAVRASKSSRDVERRFDNKHFNLKSEDHAQSEAAHRSTRHLTSEDLTSEDHAQSKAARRSTRRKIRRQVRRPHTQHLPSAPGPSKSELRIVVSGSLLFSRRRTKSRD